MHSVIWSLQASLMKKNKKMFGFTVIEVLFKVLFMGDLGKNRKEGRVR